MTLLDKVSGSVSFMDRNEAKKLVQYIEEGKITELVTEEFSRLGRNTGDVISTLDWLDSHRVNVKNRNLGIESRPNGKKNPVWKILSATMSSVTKRVEFGMYPKYELIISHTMRRSFATNYFGKI